MYMLFLANKSLQWYVSCWGCLESSRIDDECCSPNIDITPSTTGLTSVVPIQGGGQVIGRMSYTFTTAFNRSSKNVNT